MKQRILILGDKGMAGHIIKSYLHSLNKYEIYSTNRQGENAIKFSAEEFYKLPQIIKEVQPQIIINCIGILIQQSNDDFAQAILINGYFPHFLSQKAEEFNFKLIHLSTDCVFSGKKGDYKEDDFKDASSPYGITKAIGEINNDHDLTIRTSIIGPELKDGSGLMHWFFNQKEVVNGYDKVFWTGLTTLELAKVIDQLIENPITGLIHAVPQKNISKYDLLSLMSLVFKKNIKINIDNSKKNDKGLLQTKDINLKISDYKKMIEDLEIYIKKNKYSTGTYHLLF